MTLAVVAHVDAAGCGGWRLDVAERDFSSLTHLLSPDERARCDAMKVERAAHLRRAAHLLKREVVGARLNLPPEALKFADGDSAPRLLAPHDGQRLSLSHSGDAIAVAVADTPVGIDIEQIARGEDAIRLAARYFAADEASAISASPDAAFEFAWRWTAKEALLKARGMSLTDALSVSMGAQRRRRDAAPFALQAGTAAISVFVPAPGYVSSIVRL